MSHPRRRSTDAPRARRRRALSIALSALAGLSIVVIVGLTALSLTSTSSATRTLQDQAAALERQAERIDSLQAQQGRSARAVLRQSCERLNQTRRALRTIIRRGDRNLAKFYADGAITLAQYQRALRASEDARGRLHDADCVRLSRRIPIT